MLLRTSDGRHGWPDHAPFDRIVAWPSATELPVACSSKPDIMPCSSCPFGVDARDHADQRAVARRPSRLTAPRRSCAPFCAGSAMAALTRCASVAPTGGCATSCAFYAEGTSWVSMYIKTDLDSAIEVERVPFGFIPLTGDAIQALGNCFPISKRRALRERAFSGSRMPGLEPR